MALLLPRRQAQGRIAYKSGKLDGRCRYFDDRGSSRRPSTGRTITPSVRPSDKRASISGKSERRRRSPVAAGSERKKPQSLWADAELPCGRARQSLGQGPSVRPARAMPWLNGRDWYLDGPTGQAFAREMVGPLGRCLPVVVHDSPGRCPGLGEWLLLRSEAPKTPIIHQRGLQPPQSVTAPVVGSTIDRASSRARMGGCT